MTIKLRDYQLQALAAEAQHRIDHPDETRLAIVMATGLGKGTLIAERAWRFIQDELKAIRLGGERELGTLRRALILAPTDEIVTDLAARCRLISGDCIVGIVKAEYDQCDADIVVASVQTLLNPERRARIKDVGLVIVDECEAYVAPEWRKVLEHYGCFRYVGPCWNPRECGGVHPEPTPALGFTATLERGDGMSLGGVWQNVCFTRDISWGVRKGYLVQPIGYRLEINTDIHLGGLAGIDDAALIEAMAPEKIVEKWLETAAGLCAECLDAVSCLDRPAMPAYCPNGCLGQARSTVAFMPLVRSAIALSDAFTRAGIAATWISGTLPDIERRLRLSEYEHGTYRVLVNAMVLTRGWDSPRTKCVIVGRPTKSRPLFVQMAGRGLRPAPGIPVEEQDCILLCVADATTDLCTVADLSDKPIDRKAQGALTVMEDQWDIGAGLEDPEHLWTGQVDARQFDPLVTRSSKVWRTTKHGTPFLPISKDQEYVFIVGTSVFVYRNAPAFKSGKVAQRLYKDLPDLEMAMAAAEDEAQERGGDLGKLLADRNRAWRKQVPSAEMQGRAQQLGLGKELLIIMESRASGKAGKVSDLISVTIATRTLEPMVERIKEATA